MGQAPLILVCDDSRNIAQSVVALLQAAGYRAAASREALECVGMARKERPALIIMDIMMPSMDGAMASELMGQYPELQGIPIVLFSALSEEEVRSRAQESGAVDFLCKPFKKEGLLAIVRRWAPQPSSAT